MSLPSCNAILNATVEAFCSPAADYGSVSLGLRDAGRWVSCPLVGANVFLTDPEQEGVSEAAGDLTTLHSTLGATLLNKADYTYNPAGRRTSLTTTAGTTTFRYAASG